MLLFCFVLFFRNLMIILMVSQNITTYQKSAGLNDLPIIFITLSVAHWRESKQTVPFHSGFCKEKHTVHKIYH